MPRALTSILARTLLATFLGVAITVGVALAFMARAMSASAEAGLVDFAVDGTERTRASIADRLSEVDAELAAAAWAFRAARAFEVPTLLPPVVLAARVDGAGEALEIERVDGAVERLVAARGRTVGLGPSVADETTVVVARIDDEVRVDALVDFRSLLEVGEGTMWLAGDADDPRLALSGGAVLASRRTGADGAELVETASIVTDGIVLHARYPLAPARAGVRATVRQAVISASVFLGAIVLLVSFLLARGFTRPVRELAAAVRSAAPGKPLNLPPGRDDELGDLGNALLTMHGALRRDAALLGASAAFARRMTFARHATA